MSDSRDTGRSSRPGRLAETPMDALAAGYALPQRRHLSLLSHPLTKPLGLLLTVALAAAALGYATASLRFAEISKRQAAQGEQMRQRISFLESVAAQQALSTARAQAQPQGATQDKPAHATAPGDFNAPTQRLQIGQADPGVLPQVQALQVVRPVSLPTTSAQAAPQPNLAKVRVEQAALTRNATLGAQEARQAKQAKDADAARVATQGKLAGAGAPTPTAKAVPAQAAPVTTATAAVDAQSRPVKVPSEKQL